MRPLTVLDLRDTYEVGGPGKTILETYRAIDAARFRLHLGVFLTRHERDDSPFIRAARAIGMPVHAIRAFNQFDPRLVWRVARLVDQIGADIVHAHEVKSDVIVYLTSYLRRVPIVTTLHGWFGDRHKDRAFIALDKLVARGFDRVIAVSGRIRDDALGAGVGNSRVRLLHNAIVLDRYRRTGPNGFVEKLLGRRLSRPLISSIGRLSSEKGHSDLLEAFSILSQRGHVFSAVFAGDGPERSALFDRIRALGLHDRVHLLGHVDVPQRLLQETDLMVLPSHTEGLPNAVLEALAMTVPVVATRVGGTPEVVSDGETGCLVQPRDPAALADAIGDFLKNPAPWRVLAERGRESVEQLFNFETRTRALEAIYTDVVREHRR